MSQDAALRRHARAVAYVRWQLAAEKYSALGRAHADAAADENELEAAAEHVRRRRAEWTAFDAADATAVTDDGAARTRDEATQ
jgi:hypothetical protein